MNTDAAPGTATQSAPGVRVLVEHLKHGALGVWDASTDERLEAVARAILRERLSDGRYSPEWVEDEDELAELAELRGIARGEFGPGPTPGWDALRGRSDSCYCTAYEGVTLHEAKDTPIR